MQHRMERRYFRVHGMLLLLSHENIEGPASLSPLLSSILRKKEGSTEKYCCPLSERKEKDAYSTTNWKLNGKQGICLTGSIHPRSEIVLNVSLSWSGFPNAKKRKKNHTGRERNCGGGSSGIENENKKFFFIPCMIIWAITHIFSLEEEKKE